MWKYKRFKQFNLHPKLYPFNLVRAGGTDSSRGTLPTVTYLRVNVNYKWVDVCPVFDLEIRGE